MHQEIWNNIKPAVKTKKRRRWHKPLKKKNLKKWVEKNVVGINKVINRNEN